MRYLLIKDFNGLPTIKTSPDLILDEPPLDLDSLGIFNFIHEDMDNYDGLILMPRYKGCEDFTFFAAIFAAMGKPIIMLGTPEELRDTPSRVKACAHIWVTRNSDLRYVLDNLSIFPRSLLPLSVKFSIRSIEAVV